MGKPKITQAEMKAAFSSGSGALVPPILTSEELADLFRISPKTLDEWVAKGRLDGAFRRRGKRRLFWRDRAVDLILNGKDWTYE